MERRVGSDLDFTRVPGFTTVFIADVQSKYKYLETWGRSLSVKSKLSVNMRLSESQECSGVDLVKMFTFQYCDYLSCSQSYAA